MRYSLSIRMVIEVQYCDQSVICPSGMTSDITCAGETWACLSVISVALCKSAASGVPSPPTTSYWAISHVRQEGLGQRRNSYRYCHANWHNVETETTRVSVRPNLPTGVRLGVSADQNHTSLFPCVKDYVTTVSTFNYNTFCLATKTNK